jgi:hypothetical protein
MGLSATWLTFLHQAMTKANTILIFHSPSWIPIEQSYNLVQFILAQLSSANTGVYTSLFKIIVKNIHFINLFLLCAMLNQWPPDFPAPQWSMKPRLTCSKYDPNNHYRSVANEPLCTFYCSWFDKELIYKLKFQFICNEHGNILVHSYHEAPYEKFSHIIICMNLSRLSWKVHNRQCPKEEINIVGNR